MGEASGLGAKKKKKKNTCRHEHAAAGVKSSLATREPTCAFIPALVEDLKACDGAATT